MRPDRLSSFLERIRPSSLSLSLPLSSGKYVLERVVAVATDITNDITTDITTAIDTDITTDVTSDISSDISSNTLGSRHPTPFWDILR